MGMDVHGIEPKNKIGEYFRANVWSWRPIHAITTLMCEDLLDEETLMSMCYNDGKGVDDGDVCKKMGNRITQWLEHNVNGLELEDSHCRVNERGIFQFTKAINNPETTRSAYQVDDDDVREWAEFLQNCGGFEVW